jgi:hypothetical protein
MSSWNADRIWHWAMGLAFPLALGSFCADRGLMEAFLGLWEEMTPARGIFLLSSAILLIGFSRNSARLRALLERQAAASDDEPPARRVLEPCND